MIIEPEKYFQYTIPKLHTLWNGKIRDFSHQAIAGYQHFISAYQDKKTCCVTIRFNKRQVTDIL